MNKKVMWLGVGSVVLATALITGKGVWSMDDSPVENIEEAVKNAKTKADHDAIVGYFEQETNELQKRAEQHRRLAAQYQKNPVYGKLRDTMAKHCDTAARSFDKAAEESSALAKLHHQLAGKAQP